MPNPKSSTIIWIILAALWFIAFAVGPSLSGFICALLCVALAFYDYMLMWAKDIIDESDS